MGLKTFPATVKGAFISLEAPLPLLRTSKALSRKCHAVLSSLPSFSALVLTFLYICYILLTVCKGDPGVWLSSRPPGSTSS
jgi:hypothetical protein